MDQISKRKFSLNLDDSRSSIVRGNELFVRFFSDINFFNAIHDLFKKKYRRKGGVFLWIIKTENK